MPKAGLFAGELTESAPSNGAITDKPKGYAWMESGNIYVPPNSCNEIWTLATLTPDVHFAGVDAGVWTQNMIHGVGAVAVIQPGGSIRDEEAIQAADEHGMTMLFSGVRHFRH